MSFSPGEARPVGGTDVTVTALGLGGGGFASLYRHVSDDGAAATVSAAWDEGVRYFDTAPLYGHGRSEQRLGEALRARPRDDLVVSTKVGRRLVSVDRSESSESEFVDPLPFEPVFDFSPDALRESIRGSEQRLGIDRPDIVFLHDADEDRWMETGTDPRAEEHLRRAIDVCYPVIADLKRNGSCRAIGVAMNQWMLPQGMVEAVDIDVVLLAGRYTLLEQTPMNSFFPLCEDRNVSVIVGGPYNSGILATGSAGGGFYNYGPASEEILDRVRCLEATCDRHDVCLRAAALQFPLAHPVVASIIPGASSAGEVNENCELLREEIPAGFWHDLMDDGLIDERCPVPDEESAR